MEMRVDAAVVRSEREKRAWSQEHLSKACGLGVRTVQRIEKTGLASYESAQALASVFSMNVADLQGSTGRSLGKARTAFGATAAIAIALGGLFLGKLSIADQIMLDVDASRRDQGSGAETREIVRLLIADGKVAEMRIDEVLRLLVAPTLQEDGRVLLSARIFEYLDGQYVLLAEPELITADQKEAEIRISSDSGKLFRFVITPDAN